MRFKRIISSFLLAGFTLSASSCGFVIINDVSKDTRSETSSSEETDGGGTTNSGYEYTEFKKYDGGESRKKQAEKYLAELPERDFEGEVFFITTTDSSYISPDESMGAVSRLALERNTEIEDKLNITLLTTVTTSENMLDELKKAVAADLYYTDLLMLPIYTVGTFKMSDTLINLRSLPFFDLDKPYFNSDSSDMTSGGYSTYGVAGDASLSPESFSAVYVNKALLSMLEKEPSELYSEVRDGKWTWDKYLTLTEALGDINASADGQKYYTTTSGSSSDRLPDLIFKASGKDFVSTGIRRVPVVGYTPKTTEKVMDTLEKIYTDPYKIIDASAGGVNIFAKGESLFLIEYTSMMHTLADSVSEWGIVPLPKEAEAGKYRTLVSNKESVFAVPVNHTNGEYAAITLSYLNAASYGYIYDEYVNDAMLHLLRDNYSVEMLDMIIDTPAFDFALAFGNAYPTIAQATYRLIRDCAPYNNLDKYFDERRKTANATMRKYFDLKY